MESSTADHAETPLEEDVGARPSSRRSTTPRARTADQIADPHPGRRFDDHLGRAARARRRARRRACRSSALKRGDTLALMFPNQFEFHLADLAAMTVGATPFSLYVTASPEQIQYVVGDAGAKIAVIDEQFAERFLKAKDDCPTSSTSSSTATAPEGTLKLEDVEGDPDPDFDAEAVGEQVKPDDLLTLIYTSGTTGPPKGVELTHDNLSSRSRASSSSSTSRPDGRVISWLPNAHVAERNAHHYIPIVLGPARSRLRRPAPDRRGAQGGAPELVLRGAAHLGEDQGRPGGDGRRPARASRARRRAARWRRRSRRCASSRRGEDVPDGARRGGQARPTRSSSPTSGRCSASTSSRRATSARRRRRPRCSSSSTPSASRSPSCGG